MLQLSRKVSYSTFHYFISTRNTSIFVDAILSAQSETAALIRTEKYIFAVHVYPISWNGIIKNNVNAMITKTF